MSRHINSADVLHTLKTLLYETALNQEDLRYAEVFEDIAKNRVETWVNLMPTADVVAQSVVDQVRWERDTAIAQLAEIGKGFGETMDDVVERKKGQWIAIDGDPCETPQSFECDRCGFVLDDWIQGVFYNFCPNCGADMRERGEDE